MPYLLLVLTVFGLFGKVIISGESLWGSDLLLQFYPWKRFLYDAVTIDGSLPFWNPYLFSGTPYIANIQASMFYPLGFLYYLLPTGQAYLYSTILHAIMGMVFMYRFMRSLDCSMSGAFLSGFIFMFNGYFMAHLYAGHLSFVQNYIWIPLIFLFLAKFAKTRRWTYAIWGGLFLGVQILGGFPQIAFYTILGILMFSLYAVVTNVKTPNGKIPNTGIFAASSFTISVGSVLLIALGFLVSAIQLLPTYEFTQLSTRAGGIGYQFATMDSLPPRNLLTFIFPLFFGSPVDGTFWKGGATWEFWEYCGYVGVSALGMVLLSFRRLLLDRMGLFFVLLILISLFLAFGKYNPLYPLIYHLPGFNSFRIPAQILFLFVFSMAVLSGKALDIQRGSGAFEKSGIRILVLILFLFLPLVIWSSLFPENFSSAIFHLVGGVNAAPDRDGLIGPVISRSLLLGYGIFLAFTVFLCLKKKNSISKSVFAGMAIALVMVDLGSFANPLIRSWDVSKVSKAGGALSHITQDPAVSRSVINGRCFIENAGLWYGFQDIQGYDPLILRRYMMYINRSQGIDPDEKVVNLHYIKHFDNKLIRMLNLEFVVECDRMSIRKMSPLIPRCWIVHEAEAKNREETLDFMREPGFDPRKTVVLEPRDVPEALFTETPRLDIAETCGITRYEKDDMALLADLASPGFLVLSEIDYPGWQVYVNGEKREILRGNYLFRTIPLEPGRHKIRLRFSPMSFKLGAAVSIATLLLVMVCLLHGRKRQPGKEG